MRIRLLAAALVTVLASQTGCIVVTKRRQDPVYNQPRQRTTDYHCHPKPHGREVCHSHPHYDPGHH